MEICKDEEYLICGTNSGLIHIFKLNGEKMKSGRLHGPRGNLRDSQGDSITITVQGQTFPIHNWCYQFDMPIEMQ